VTLASFPRPLKAAVFGASGGIGGAICAALTREPAVTLHAFSRSGRAPEDVEARRFDVEDEASVAAAAEAAGPLDLCVVAVGRLHGEGLAPEKDMRALDMERLTASFRANAAGPALIGKHVLPRLPRRRRCVFAVLSARVGSVGDNRLGGWYGYRASKAALNMILKNFAIELGRRRPEAVVLGLQPGTVETALSKPFRGSAISVMTPDESANRLLDVIDHAEPSWSGGLYDWRGERLPY
jgi:NAD(P)-dependent dehydrogenase (short-subunit alcohol dehydrogenase family)